MIQELDVVVLTTDLPSEGLVINDAGTVVAVYDNGAGFEVEFVTLLGQTISVVTVPAHAIRPLEKTDISHVRHSAVA